MMIGGYVIEVAAYSKHGAHRYWVYDPVTNKECCIIGLTRHGEPSPRCRELIWWDGKFIRFGRFGIVSAIEQYGQCFQPINDSDEIRRNV